MPQSMPMKLRKTIRFSTGMKVKLTMEAMGHILYPAMIMGMVSFDVVRRMLTDPRRSQSTHFLYSCLKLGQIFAFHHAHDDQESKSVHNGSHEDAVKEPLLERIDPIEILFSTSFSDDDFAPVIVLVQKLSRLP